MVITREQMVHTESYVGRFVREFYQEILNKETIDLVTITKVECEHCHKVETFTDEYIMTIVKESIFDDYIESLVRGSISYELTENTITVVKTSYRSYCSKCTDIIEFGGAVIDKSKMADIEMIGEYALMVRFDPVGYLPHSLAVRANSVVSEVTIVNRETGYEGHGKGSICDLIRAFESIKKKAIEAGVDYLFCNVYDVDDRFNTRMKVYKRAGFTNSGLSDHCLILDLKPIQLVKKDFLVELDLLKF